MIIHLRPMKTVLKILFYFFTSILIINCSLPEKKCTLYKMEDKKSISMKILSTDEKGYNFEFSIVGNKDTFFRGRANKIN